jgi:hypothetical protein
MSVANKSSRYGAPDWHWHIVCARVSARLEEEPRDVASRTSEFVVPVGDNWPRRRDSAILCIEKEGSFFVTRQDADWETLRFGLHEQQRLGIDGIAIFSKIWPTRRHLRIPRQGVFPSLPLLHTTLIAFSTRAL